MTVYKIGTSSGTITDLKSLSTPIPYPYQKFTPYSKLIPTADGGVVGVGWATDEWEWGFLTANQRNTLKAFCTNASSNIYIQTYNDSIVTPAWKIYRAKMIWTQEEDRQSGRRIRVKIVFRLIEDVTPP